MNRAPLIVAVILLLLPVLYVGSYLALYSPAPDQYGSGSGYRRHPRIFWPLETIDRMIRPAKWKPLPVG
jgi:hypothetical protein